MIEKLVMKSCRQAVEKYERRAAQEEAIRKVTRWLEAEADKPLILKLPTGYGKTLIGFAPMLYQISSNDWRYSRGLTYVLPMRTLCSQIADRARTFARNVNRSWKGPKIRVEEFHGASPHSSTFDGDIIVTTYDTFIYAYGRKLGVQLEYPAGTLATSIIVFDEAQLLQDEAFYSYTLLNRVVKALSGVGVPMLFMTATLPTKIKDVTFQEVDIEEFSKDPRNETFKGRIIDIMFEKYTLNLEIILKAMKDYSKIFGEKPKRVFVICNTVKRLEGLFRQLIERRREGILQEYEIISLHGRLRKIERKVKAERLEKTCGKPDKREAGKPIILLATQVIEAGMDISADLMITELAPADALLQRAGRCARFRGEKGMLVVVEVKDKESYPYPRELIRDTREVLTETVDNLDRVLLSLKGAEEFIEKAYNKWEPKNVERDFENIRYISYLERSLGVLSGDLETARSLKTRLDDYIDLIIPRGRVRYATAIKGGDETFTIKKQKETLNLHEVLEEAMRLKGTGEYVAILGGDVNGRREELKDWLLGNSVSITVEKGDRLPKAATWNVKENRKMLFALYEVPAQRVRNADSSIALLIPVERVFRERVYLGNPEFYEPDIGVKE